jgi:hypothetical protein
VGFVIVIVMAKCAHFAPNCFDQREMVAMRQFEKFNVQSTQKNCTNAHHLATQLHRLYKPSRSRLLMFM